MKKAVSASERLFLERARVCRIGSVGRDGRPHVAPLCHALDRRTLYVATDRGGRTARNLRRSPRATIACDDYLEDWDRLRGVVAQARAWGVERGAELERARRLLTEKYSQYRDEDIDYVIALRIERMTSWGI